MKTVDTVIYEFVHYFIKTMSILLSSIFKIKLKFCIPEKKNKQLNHNFNSAGKFQIIYIVVQRHLNFFAIKKGKT